MGILIITFIVAFCSIVYELILGQALSAFLGDTITRYSITIGLYLFSMGFGAMIAEGKMEKKPEKYFIIIELLLTFLGGLSIVMLFLSQPIVPAAIFVFLAHMLIVIIGVLTGFEIPLLIYIGKKYKNLKEGTVIGVDYLGAFLGSISFSFLFYPLFGLTVTAFSVAILNGLAGIFVFNMARKELRKDFKAQYFFALQTFAILLLIFFLAGSNYVNDYLIAQYLR